MTYRQFRTGLTFADVRRMLWVEGDDRATWKHKSRGVVLWHMRQIKLELWAIHLAAEEAARAERRRLEWAAGFGRLHRRKPRNEPCRHGPMRAVHLDGGRTKAPENDPLRQEGATGGVPVPRRAVG